MTRLTRRHVRRRGRDAPRVLVVGDSSAAGTGASRSGATVAGRLAARYPEATIGNLGVPGSRTSDVADVLQRLARRVGLPARGMLPYAVVVIHTGGNDALHVTPLRAASRDLARALASAARLSAHTAVVTGGNFALAPGLPQPLAWIGSRWERRLRDRFRRLCGAHGAVYVDLYHDADTDPTVGSPGRFFAEDGLHPSDDNYRLWFTALDRGLRDRGAQAALRG